jgi:hypothetical protein
MKTKVFTVSISVALISFALNSSAQRDGRPGGEHVGGFGGGHVGGMAPRAPIAAPRGGGVVERFNHGSIHHEDAHAFRTPEPRFERRAEPRFEMRGGERHGFFTHHDVNVDVRGNHYWHDFHRGRILHGLPLGYLSFNIGGLPYFYYGGVYYQQAPDGFEEVYPPVGAALPFPPDGAYPVVSYSITYYYAAGAFYVQQPDGTFVSIPPPLGVVVPELPPGSLPVNVNGVTLFQFNGTFYQPIFVNGVTQYQVVKP